MTIRRGEHLEPRLGARSVADVQAQLAAVVEDPADGATHPLHVQVVAAGIEGVRREQRYAVEPVGQLCPEAHGLAEGDGPPVVHSVGVRPRECAEVRIEAFIALPFDDPLAVDLAFEVAVGEDERGVLQTAGEADATDPLAVLEQV